MHSHLVSSLLKDSHISSNHRVIHIQGSIKHADSRTLPSLPPSKNSHHSIFLSSVNLDPSSHSVYLAGGNWHAYSQPNLDGNNNNCQGENLGALGGGCQNLDDVFAGQRVACVQL